MNNSDLKCREPRCKDEVRRICWCTGTAENWCDTHFNDHLRSLGADYKFDPPLLDTKKEILTLLWKESNYKEQLKKDILNSISQSYKIYENSIRQVINELDNGLELLMKSFRAVLNTKKISKSEKEPILNVLLLPPYEATCQIKILAPEMFKEYNTTKFDYDPTKATEKIIECFLSSQLAAFKARFFKIAEIVESKKKLQESQLKEVKILISDLKRDIQLDENELERKKNASDLKWKDDCFFGPQFSSISNSLREKFKNLTLLELEKKLKQNDEVELSNVQEWETKRSAIFSRAIDWDLEADFRKTCSSYEQKVEMNRFSNAAVDKAYNRYIDAYCQVKSTYECIESREDKRATALHRWDTERGGSKMILLNAKVKVNEGTCMTILPDGRLFCFGRTNPKYGNTYIIDLDYMAQEKEHGISCEMSSAIYYNANVYCFGGRRNRELLTLSARFDLVKNKWFNLEKLPYPDYLCHCIRVNGNILIAGFSSAHLYRYITSENDFTTINYAFQANKAKVLIYGERLARLHLIEFDGSIYESQLGDETEWTRLTGLNVENQTYYGNKTWAMPANSDSFPKDFQISSPVYCSYNKGYAFISGSYIFDLKTKHLSEYHQ